MCGTQPKTEQAETNPPSLADIVREMTDNGRIIVEFLTDMVLGKMEGATYWHRLEATRQLAALGIKLPQVVVNAAAKPAKPRTQSAASTRTAPAGKTNELAEIVKLETDNGKDVVRFLVDVVCDRVADAKMCHRIAAAKELLRHCSGNILVYSDDGEERDESFDDGDQAPGPSDPDSLTYVDRRGNVLNKDHAPFDFDKYGREDYKRDRMGHRAELHIFGGEEALEVALNTARELARESRAAGHIGDYDYSPIENPEDDPYGKGCYGYNVLRIAFQNNNAIRAINKAVAEYHRRKFKHFINEDGSLAAPADTASLDPRTLQYLERSRHLLANDDDKPPDDPDPPSSITPERAHDPPVGAGFKPARGLTHPSTELHSDPSHVILSEAEGPPAPTTFPRKKTPENPPWPHRQRPAGRQPARPQRPRRNQNTAPQLAVYNSRPPVTAPPRGTAHSNPSFGIPHQHPHTPFAVVPA